MHNTQKSKSMEEIFDRCFANKTFKLTATDQDYYVSFMSIENIVLTHTGDAVAACKKVIKSHSNQVIQEKNLRSWQMSKIHVQERL